MIKIEKTNNIDQLQIILNNIDDYLPQFKADVKSFINKVNNNEYPDNQVDLFFYTSNSINIQNELNYNYDVYENKNLLLFKLSSLTAFYLSIYRNNHQLVDTTYTKDHITYIESFIKNDDQIIKNYLSLFIQDKIKFLYEKYLNERNINSTELEDF